MYVVYLHNWVMLGVNVDTSIHNHDVVKNGHMPNLLTMTFLKFTFVEEGGPIDLYCRVYCVGDRSLEHQ